MSNEEQLSGRAIAVVALAVALILLPLGRELGRQHWKGNLLDLVDRSRAARPAPAIIPRAPRLPRLSPGSTVSIIADYDTSADAPRSNRWSVTSADASAANASANDAWQVVWNPFVAGSSPTFVSAKLKIPVSPAPTPRGFYMLLISSHPDPNGHVDYFRYDFDLTRPVPTSSSSTKKSNARL